MGPSGAAERVARAHAHPADSTDPVTSGGDGHQNKPPRGGRHGLIQASGSPASKAARAAAGDDGAHGRGHTQSGHPRAGFSLFIYFF